MNSTNYLLCEKGSPFVDSKSTANKFHLITLSSSIVCV